MPPLAVNENFPKLPVGSPTSDPTFSRDRCLFVRSLNRGVPLYSIVCNASNARLISSGPSVCDKHIFVIARQFFINVHGGSAGTAKKVLLLWRLNNARFFCHRFSFNKMRKAFCRSGSHCCWQQKGRRPSARLQLMVLYMIVTVRSLALQLLFSLNGFPTTALRMLGVMRAYRAGATRPPTPQHPV